MLFPIINYCFKPFPTKFISKYFKMKNDDFIKSYVRMKPLMMDEMSVISPTRREVTVNKTKESFTFSKKNIT